MSRTSAPAVVFALATAAPALAGHYDFTVAPKSSIAFSAGATAPLAGSLVGNWDAAANPTGTRTLPGLWGGSATTNTAIPYTATLAGGLDMQGAPTGGFALNVPPEGMTGTVSGLNFDLMGEKAADILVSVDLVFQTFRTRSPDSIYFGSEAIPPIPLATGEISEIRIEQCCASEVMAMELPGMTAFAGMVEADLVVRATLLNQQVVDVAVPVMVPVAGMIDGSGTASASVEFSEAVSFPLPQLPAFEDQPVALPTILPPGGTANLLFSGTIDGPAGSFDVGIGAAIAVEGAERTADIDRDGWVDGRDIGQLLSAWMTAEPSCDLDASGQVNGTDLARLLAEWRSQ